MIYKLTYINTYIPNIKEQQTVPNHIKYPQNKLYKMFVFYFKHYTLKTISKYLNVEITYVLLFCSYTTNSEARFIVKNRNFIDQPLPKHFCLHLRTHYFYVLTLKLIFKYTYK